MNPNYSETILIIDDDVLFCDIFKMSLESKYSNISTINDGNEALEYLLKMEQIPKIIFLDHHLPGLTGLEIFIQLKENKKDLPIIFLTSMHTISIAVEVMQNGALDYIEKGKYKLEELPLLIEKNSKVYKDRIEKKILEKELIHELEERKKIQSKLELVNSDLKVEHGILVGTIEELKSAQLQLVQSEKMASLGILMAGVAHEINNPINYISSSISGLENVFNEIIESIRKSNVTKNLSNDEIESNGISKSIERIEKMLTNVKTGVSRTIQIINSLKNFSRSDENVLRMTDIHESIEITLTILHHQYKNRIEIIKTFGNISSINCFPGKINQVLMNILANAIQSIEKEGTITITTSSYSKDKVSISIQDTGCGISEKIIPNIFDPFFTTKEPGKGTGLGLSIAYDIVKQHNGQIVVKSELNKGTEFTIILPI